MIRIQTNRTEILPETYIYQRVDGYTFFQLRIADEHGASRVHVPLPRNLPRKVIRAIRDEVIRQIQANAATWTIEDVKRLQTTATNSVWQLSEEVRQQTASF